MEPRTTDEMEIDLGALIMALLYKWWIIVLAGFLTAVGAFCIAKFAIDPTYESTTSVYVISRQNENTTTTSDMTLSTQIMKDFAAFAKCRTVVEEVIKELNLDTTVKSLQKLINVSSASDTRILYITVTHTDPVMAQKIADTTREVAAEFVVKVMNVEAVNLAEKANLPMEKVAPSVSKYTLLGGFLGVFVAAAIIAVLFLLDDSIKTPDDVEKYLQLSTLGSIPYDEDGLGDGKPEKKGKKDSRHHRRSK